MVANYRYFVYEKRTQTSITKDQKVWTQGYCQYKDLLSHAHYRDHYFDFMYFADQLFVNI